MVPKIVGMFFNLLEAFDNPSDLDSYIRAEIENLREKPFYSEFNSDESSRMPLQINGKNHNMRPLALLRRLEKSAERGDALENFFTKYIFLNCLDDINRSYESYVSNILPNPLSPEVL